MVDLQLIASALSLVFHIALPLVLAALFAAILSGVLQVATQIQDQVIGFVSKLAGVGLMLYLFAGRFQGQLTRFTEALWGRPEFYQ